jgi:quinoprotein glucose dehydrogenase
MNYTQGIARPQTAPAGAANAAAGEGGPGAPTVQGLPLFKPPYGSIVAINMDKGEIAWKAAHGETPDNIRNHPALKGLNIPRTGRGGLVGILTTATLVIAGERGTFTDSQGRNAARLRAYDKATGKEVGEVFMPTGQTGSPMTYMLNGKQYIVIAIGGGGYPGELLAFSLPD